jgi:hypothetical protein
MHIASISIRSGQNHLSPALPMSATVADAVRSPLEFGLRPSRYQTASSVPGCASNSLNALARFFVYTLLLGPLSLLRRGRGNRSSPFTLIYNDMQE